VTDRMEISAHAHGLVRVFGLDLEPDEVKAFAAEGAEGWPLQDALGAEALDPDRVEVFPVRDLEGLGLSGYLRDGLGVDEDDIGADAARLDSVTGHVAVVTSAAFGRRPQTLTPRAPLRHLGTYREAGAGVSFAPLPAAGAEGEAIGTPGGPRAATAMPRLPLYLVAAIILLALLAAVLLGFGGAGE
jgi:hypothetical protein